MTNVSTSLPQLNLKSGSTFSVVASDPGSVITQLVVHGWQEEPAPPDPIPLAPVLAHVVDEGG